MPRVLMLCSSTDGQTAKICRRLQAALAAQGRQVQLAMIEEADRLDPRDFDQVVVGARIRYGRHDERVLRFVERHQAALQSMPSAFFSVNIVARKAQKNRAETNPYVRKFLARTGWRPQLVDVFAGRLDYPRYGVVDRCIIRFIMLLTKGPTRPDTVVEFTDWQRVDEFGRRLAAAPQGYPQPQAGWPSSPELARPGA